MFSTRNPAQESHSDENSIFSTPNPVLVAHFDGVTTRYSASTNRINGDLQSDLIAFLSIVQQCKVGYLPIMWQPALSPLGAGGSATISQSTFVTDMPLAFKRFRDSGDADMDFLPLMSEVLILSQPLIQSHRNIVNLEGICWEIKPWTEKAVPVLVFEKAAWDLQQFMNTHEGTTMSIEDRLKICAAIGNAIRALHACGRLFYVNNYSLQKFDLGLDVIHGDIKPQNVLVFKEATGKTIVKMTDFGYSTLTAGEAGRVFLPKSRPWNAPEHRIGEFSVHEAKRTDVYSYGMLCLWVLFGNNLSNIQPIRAECVTELVSFDASSLSRTSLEQLKVDDKLEQIANQLLDSVPLGGLEADHMIRLKEFFSLTVTLNPDKRSLDLGKLLDLINQKR